MSSTVFITGANSGVGLATVKVFLSHGWNVVGSARNPDAAVDLQNLSLDAKDKLLVLPLDMASPSTYQQALDSAVAKFGKIDVLINNAGYGQFGPLESLDMEDYRRQFDINLFGPIELTKLFIPHFRATSSAEAPAKLIYVSSGAAHFGLPFSTAYSASKAALDLFAESLSFELAQLDPPIITKLIPIHGGVKSTNFRNSSNSNNVFAPATDEDRAVAGRYKDYASKVFSIFGEMSGRAMEIEKPAEVIFKAATEEGRKLRYFVSGEDGGELLNARMKGRQEGESLDDCDEKWVAYFRSRFE
ncbi:hypothetical protein B0I35DRAFT_171398 [Stachybotrys elegans]|uniref:NAD(P)-binding protein n=1 Tax=Stachybotrys elegans TaxID=80388 RepID=A0A8K0WU65_9HYPO|nr:hypothetical protein B0I35DRAFT_171398 [Stachybotrys elegans]